MLGIVLEDFHVSRHSHKREQLDVDLHQDEELVECAEDGALCRDENPLVAAATLDILSRPGLILLIDDEETVEDDAAGDAPEQ